MQTPEDNDPNASRGWLNRTVLGAGLTSALGDFSYETCNVLLPGFLAVLGIPPAVLGTIEGLADGLSSFCKLGSGYIADKLGHRKSLVILGYALTALMPIFFALAGTWVGILLGRIVGWFGRGIRGPLRDAIMTQAVTPQNKGKAFGFHRAADTSGAIIGPLLGVALLSWAQSVYATNGGQPFRFVFWLTLIPGVLAVLSFALLVRDDGTVPNKKLQFWATLKGLPTEFRRYLGAVGLFGLGDFAHTLLILAATQLLTPSLAVGKAAMVAGFLYVWRNTVEALASFPAGALADRVGHKPVLAVGYGLGAMVATCVAIAFMLPSHVLPMLIVVFTLAGIYVAIQDSIESTVTAEYVPANVRTTGLGVLASVNGIGDLVSSMTVGFLWTAVSPLLAFGLAAVVMALGALTLMRLPNSKPVI